VGTAASATSARTASASGVAPRQWKDESRVSMDRMALPRASVKFRPSAIASPTDFIVVVSVGSAARNFSNANRGTLTTT